MKSLGFSKSGLDSNQEHDSSESAEYPVNDITPWKAVNEQPV